VEDPYLIVFPQHVVDEFHPWFVLPTTKLSLTEVGCLTEMGDKVQHNLRRHSRTRQVVIKFKQGVSTIIKNYSWLWTTVHYHTSMIKDVAEAEKRTPLSVLCPKFVAEHEHPKAKDNRDSVMLAIGLANGLA
jgi:hypothetical protein